MFASLSHRSRPIRIAAAAVQSGYQHQLGVQAAALTFYAFFSLFPLLLSLIALFGYLAPLYRFDEQLLLWTTLYLPGAESLIRSNLARLIADRQAFGLVGLLGLLWSASGLFFALARALNRIWDCADGRVLWQQRLLALVMVPGVALLVLVSMVAMTAVRLAAGRLLSIGSLGWSVQQTVSVITLLFLPLMLFVGLTLLYRYVPNAIQPWRPAAAGALAAAVSLELARYLFGWYLSFMGPQQLVYGSLTAIAGLMLWMYVASWIVLIGAEVGAALRAGDGRPPGGFQ